MSADDPIASLKRLLAEVVAERDEARAEVADLQAIIKRVDQWLPDASLASDPDTQLPLVERAVATYVFVYLCLRVLPESVLHEVARNMHNAVLLYRDKEEVAK